MSTRAQGPPRRTRLVVRYFDDQVLLTDTHTWSYCRIPSVSYEFTTAEEREALATTSPSRWPQSGWPTPRSTCASRTRLPGARLGDRPGRDLGRQPGLTGVPEQSYQYVWGKDFWAEEIYLGQTWPVRHPRAASGGVISQFRGMYGCGEKGLGPTDEAVGLGVIGKWTESAEQLGRALNASALAARHAINAEIAWLI